MDDLMMAPGSWRLAKSAFAAAFLFIAAGAAAAQTQVQTAPPDPLVESLRDQINDLEGQVRKLTGDNERLQFELSRARDDNARLTKTLDDINVQAQTQAAAPSSAPAPGKLGEIPAGAAANASGDAAADYARAYDFAAKGESAAAVEAFTAFLAAYPKDAKVPDAHYWLGQSLLADGRAPDAAAHFLNVIQKTPKAAIAPRAMVRLGVALNRIGQKQQACATLKALPTQYPNAPAETKASATANIKAIGC